MSITDALALSALVFLLAAAIVGANVALSFRDENLKRLIAWVLFWVAFLLFLAAIWTRVTP